MRDAGGAFGKMEAAREDEYFYKKQKEQLQVRLLKKRKQLVSEKKITQQSWYVERYECLDTSTSQLAQKRSPIGPYDSVIL